MPNEGTTHGFFRAETTAKRHAANLTALFQPPPRAFQPYLQMPADQVEPELISAVADRSEVHFHCVGIYLTPGSLHVGSLEVAIDDETGEACGIVSIRGFDECSHMDEGWREPG